jgi:hypothetical protein
VAGFLPTTLYSSPIAYRSRLAVSLFRLIAFRSVCSCCAKRTSTLPAMARGERLIFNCVSNGKLSTAARAIYEPPLSLAPFARHATRPGLLRNVCGRSPDPLGMVLSLAITEVPQGSEEAPSPPSRGLLHVRRKRP